MKYADFKKHKIQRTCNEKFDLPKKYRKYLEEDFHDRCCYCNMPRDLLTVPYHIEHFIPFNVFEGKKDSLNTDYNNLMWSCPKCNLSKGNKYKGDFMNETEIINELFYNPIDIDYNTIFFRNEIGGIDSEDSKGREMIKLLRLYRPIHNLAWLIEQIELTCEKLEQKIEKETDKKRKEVLEKAAGKLARVHMYKSKMFRAVYNGKIKSKE